MTRRKRLTDQQVVALPVKTARYFQLDPELNGHYVRVTPTGTKTYVATARSPYGKQVWATIGGTDLWRIEDSREEARQIIESETEIEVVLADADAPGASGFGFASWLRREHPKIKVVLAGNVAVATEKAGDLCEDGPNLAKPYDHQMVLNYIRRLLATRR